MIDYVFMHIQRESNQGKNLSHRGNWQGQKCFCRPTDYILRRGVAMADTALHGSRLAMQRRGGVLTPLSHSPETSSVRRRLLARRKPTDGTASSATWADALRRSIPQSGGLVLVADHWLSAAKGVIPLWRRPAWRCSALG